MLIDLVWALVAFYIAYSVRFRYASDDKKLLDQSHQPIRCTRKSPFPQVAKRQNSSKNS